jgi:hypothetical protein
MRWFGNGNGKAAGNGKTAGNSKAAGNGKTAGNSRAAAGDARATITRRGLFKGVGAVGATAAIATVLSGCQSSGEGGAPVMVDSSAADFVIDPNTNESKYSSSDAALNPVHTWSIALGSVLLPMSGSTWAPMTTAGASATPMVKGSALNVTTGAVAEVVPEPHTEPADNVVVYDARCSDSVYAWVELNLLTRAWRLYGARFSDGALSGSTTTLWEGSSDYDPPRFAVADSRVIWLVMPSASGSKASESSYCYQWEAGDSDARAVLESPGRFATEPTVSGDTLTLTPRVNPDEGVYYGITSYSLSNLSRQIDQLVLPASVKPMCAVRIGDKFAFSIEANYSSGGLLGTMGTYIGGSDGHFVALSREPFAEVSGKDGRYFIKSSTSYFVVNTSDRSYQVLTAENRCVDYGEYPASVGECSLFTTFATVKHESTGQPASVTVRVFEV